METPKEGFKLGDTIEAALTKVGITKTVVEKWLGEECGCVERKEKLNRLGEWATRIIKGKVDGATKYFNSLTNSGDSNENR